jgi:iron complex outermembrane receptor protein
MTDFTPRFRLLPCLIAGLFPLSSQAAEPRVTTDQVVVTATRMERNSFDLPVSIDVVAAEQMQFAQPMVNTSESLWRVPGIFAPNTTRFSSDQQISSRGFGARSAFGVRGIRLYADGIPQSMPDGQGQMGTFDLSTADRMEVMRGPFSALYGNSSGGVLQIFTRDGKGPHRVTASTYGGSYDTWRVGVVAEGGSDSFGYLVDASRYESDGYRDHSAVRRDQANAKLTWKGEKTRVTLVMSSLDQPYNEDPQGLTRAQMEADPRQVAAPSTLSQNAGGNKAQTQAGLNVQHQLTQNDTLQAIVWGGTRETLGRLTVPFSATAVIKGSGGISYIDRDFYGVDARWSHRADTGVGPLTLTFGLNYEYMKDLRKGFENKAGQKGVLRRDEDNIVSNSGQYLQGEWEIGKDWILSGGLRYTRVRFENDDRYIRTTGAGNPDDSGSVTYTETTPVLGVVYHLNPRVNLYANAGKGFETPTFIELAYRSGGQSGLNFGLQPSTSINYEAGIKALVGDSTRINAAIYHVKTDKEVVVDVTAFGRSVYDNAGETRRKGLELGVESDLTQNLKASLAYTYLDARFAESYTNPGKTKTIDSGNKLPCVPSNTFFGELEWKHPASGFKTAVDARYSGKVYVDDLNSAAAKSYTIFNWRAGFEQRLGAVKLAEFVRVENIGDKNYVGGVSVNDANGRFYYPAAERNYLFGISASIDL